MKQKYFFIFFILILFGSCLYIYLYRYKYPHNISTHPANGTITSINNIALSEPKERQPEKDTDSPLRSLTRNNFQEKAERVARRVEKVQKALLKAQARSARFSKAQIDEERKRLADTRKRLRQHIASEPLQEDYQDEHGEGWKRLTFDSGLVRYELPPGPGLEIVSPDEQPDRVDIWNTNPDSSREEASLK